MNIAGYVEYQQREYCKDVRCPVQLALNAQVQGSADYERIRQVCHRDCKHTAWEFHHWLIGKAFVIVRPNKGAM